MAENETTRNSKSEIVLDIIDKMPTKFGVVVTAVILTILVLLFLFGWIIRYPDLVSGTIVINAKYAPVKLVANASGKMTLFNFKPKDLIKEDDYIALLQNPANTSDVIKVKTLLKKFSINDMNIEKAITMFPNKVSLGDINEKYYAFLNALQKKYSFEVANVNQKQIEGIKEQIDQLNQLLINNKKLKVTRESNMSLYKKMSDRDSLLLSQKVTTEAELDNSRVSYLNSKENFQSITNDINNTEQRITEDENKLKQLYVQNDDDKSQTQLDLISSYDALLDEIKAWEQHFVFKAPMNGTIEFLKFWNNNQFIQTGDEVFTIIPKVNKVVGQVQLPSQGAGKVKIGQEVIIKLNNYPYEEYGSITGKVSSISLTTNVLKSTNQTNIDAYLIDVDLPNSLTTNYGARLDFKFEIKGTADIVTNDRDLIERFFDNLKYVSKKN